METGPLIPLIAVGVGGFLGATARYVVDGRIAAYTGGAFPWGTFTINVTGSFAVGMVFALIIERGVLPAEMRAPLMIGFLGSYTTFSTLALESWRMMEDGAWLYATANIGASIALGLIAVVAGVALGRAL